MIAGTRGFTHDILSSYFRPDRRHAFQAKDTGTSELQFKTGSTKDGLLVLTEIEEPLGLHARSWRSARQEAGRRVAVKEVPSGKSRQLARHLGLREHHQRLRQPPEKRGGAFCFSFLAGGKELGCGSGPAALPIAP